MPRHGRGGPLTDPALPLLGGLCLFLSGLEYLIPKPLPFMRIGLANLPLLIALDLLSPGDFGVLVLVKVLGQGLITGTLVSPVVLFSLAGTAASALVMYPGRRFLSPRLVGFTGLSVMGSLCSNLAQIGLARFLVFGGGIRFLIPPFLGAGILTGAALGIFCEAFTRRSRWYRHAAGGADPPPLPRRAAGGFSAPPGAPGPFPWGGTLCRGAPHDPDLSPYPLTPRAGV